MVVVHAGADEHVGEDHAANGGDSGGGLRFADGVAGGSGLPGSHGEVTNGHGEDNSAIV
jgi:hypothetical protein